MYHFSLEFSHVTGPVSLWLHVALNRSVGRGALPSALYVACISLSPAPSSSGALQFYPAVPSCPLASAWQGLSGGVPRGPNACNSFKAPGSLPSQKAAPSNSRAAPIHSGPGTPPCGLAVGYDAESAAAEPPEIQHHSSVIPSCPNARSSVMTLGSPPGSRMVPPSLWAAPIRGGPTAPPHKPAGSCNTEHAAAALSGLQCPVGPPLAARSVPETPLTCPHCSPQLRAVTDPRRGYVVRIIIGPDQSRNITRPPSLQIRPHTP
ncbi:hypothetical protein NDU88_001710 [Pleurodeles waltl]|uniref:Uncharacterized protein n=1 Tax=Pleurodeles waltl TaxID=8319 RepID=A0AAV7MQN5_PLEWA|nr:hypothetical protein NDU88_001710 [Pleurodeles waltl]